MLTNLYTTKILAYALYFAFVETVPVLQTTYDFRKVRWGMNQAEVRSTESQKPSTTNDTQLIYSNVFVGGERAELMYTFSNNKLSGGVYRFLTPLTSAEQYISRYNKVSDYIVSVYGNSTSHKIGKSSHKGPVQNHQTLWIAPRRLIVLSMDSNDSSVLTTALFSNSTNNSR